MLRQLIFMLLAISAIAAATPAGADPVFPLGLRVGLEPAGNLKPSKRLPGFEDEDNKVVVAILDLPGRAYEDLERTVFSKTQPGGLTDLKRESFPFVDGVGFLVSGQVQPNGIRLRKWFLLANVVGNAVDMAVLVNVEVPEAATSIYTDAVVRKMLASVTFRPAPLQEQLSRMPFTIDEFAGFRLIQVMPEGGVILTDGPTNNINSQPYMIVSVERGAPDGPDERAKFARDLLSSAPLRDLQVQSSDAMRIGGRQGFEIRAQAKALGGAPVSVVQWVRFGSGGYLRVIGVAPKDDWDALFTRFRTVRDGIEAR